MRDFEEPHNVLLPFLTKNIPFLLCSRDFLAHDTTFVSLSTIHVQHFKQFLKGE